MNGAKIVVTPAGTGAPAGKLADAEVHFTEGPLKGLKLVGFSVWEGRDGGDRGVTFPARQYMVNGERRHYVLLRTAAHAPTNASEDLRKLILSEYAQHEQRNDL